MKVMYLTLFAVLGLCGCAHQVAKSMPASVKPTVVINAVAVPTQPQIKTVVVNHDVSVERKSTPCATLPAPKDVALPTAPNAPAGKPLNDKQRIQLMQSYIWSLLGYIKSSQQTAHLTYDNYVKSCVTQDPTAPSG